jgi:hypothetical protein
MIAARANATMLVSLATGGAVAVGGPIWAVSDEERAAMIEAYAAWFVTQEVMPPWMGAVICTATYALPRLAITMAEIDAKRAIRKNNGNANGNGAR